MTSDTDDTQPEDSIRERAGDSTRFLWLLLDADRWVVTSLLSVALFVAIVGVGLLVPDAGLTAGDPVETLYQALITSTITGVTLVLTLGQLILSQELGPVGDQRDRMDGAMNFREDVGDAIGTAIPPAEPSAFLRALVTATREQVEAIRADTTVDDQSDQFGTVLDSIADNADEVADQLRGGNFGEFDVVRAALNYNYSWKLYAVRRFKADNAQQFSEETRARLDSLATLLELFGPARAHFKTLYFQWELSNLSRQILYVAMPALAVSILSLLFLDPTTVDGATVGVSHALVLVAATTTVSLLPFTILLAYILRIVTIAKRTLSIGPFVLRETDREVTLDRD